MSFSFRGDAIAAADESPPLSAELRDDDPRPSKSPYSSSLRSLFFRDGGPLHLPLDLIFASPKLRSLSQTRPLSTTFNFTNFPISIGHIVVHFLFTGRYESLKPTGETQLSWLSSEFDTALLAYDAADFFDLPQLANLAASEIHRVGDELSLARIVDIMESTSSTHNQGIRDYLRSRVHSFCSNLTIRSAEQALIELGAHTTLSRSLLVNMIWFMKGSIPREDLHEERSVDEPSEETSEKPVSPTEGRSPEEFHFLDKIPTAEEPTEETIPDEPVPDEPFLAEAALEDKSVLCEAAPEEESVPEEPPGEALAEEMLDEEDNLREEMRHTLEIERYQVAEILEEVDVSKPLEDNIHVGHTVFSEDLAVEKRHETKSIERSSDETHPVDDEAGESSPFEEISIPYNEEQPEPKETPGSGFYDTDWSNAHYPRSSSAGDPGPSTSQFWEGYYGVDSERPEPQAEPIAVSSPKKKKKKKLKGKSLAGTEAPPLPVQGGASLEGAVYPYSTWTWTAPPAPPAPLPVSPAPLPVESVKKKKKKKSVRYSEDVVPPPPPEPPIEQLAVESTPSAAQGTEEMVEVPQTSDAPEMTPPEETTSVDKVRCPDMTQHLTALGWNNCSECRSLVEQLSGQYAGMSGDK